MIPVKLTSEQKQFILLHEREDVHETALRYAREDMPLLLSQIAGRQMAEKKIPSWYAEKRLFYPPHLSLEQSSSELTARYKASLIPDSDGNTAGSPFTDAAMAEKPPQVGNDSLVDLTGGMGVDFTFMSQKFSTSVYVEQDEDLCRIASYNFQQLGLEHTTIHCADAEAFLKAASPAGFIYLDPSRRDNTGRKRVQINDCTPDVSKLVPLLLEKSERAMVKYSPMLDISLAMKSLGCVEAVHVVSVDNECKELLFLLSKRAVGETRLTAVNLKKNGEKESFSFTPEEERNRVVRYAGNPRRYLYEPNASILKAGAFKSVADAFAVEKLHVNSHLYTSAALIADFPGRLFEIVTYFLPNRKNLKNFLSETKKANISVRNFPMTVNEIRLKTGLESGGDIYLFATTLSDERKVWIVCRKTG